MTSIQRRNERYLIIYTWQILENKVINNGNVKAVWTDYKGRKVVIPSPKGKDSTRTLRNNAFMVRGVNYLIAVQWKLEIIVVKDAQQ